MIAFMNRNIFNDMKKVFVIALGGDVFYLPYVLDMVGVNWTNKHTRTIEGKMMKSYLKQLRSGLRKYIPIALEEQGLGWMTGRGFQKKELEVLTSRGIKRKIPGYRGDKRILQWLDR